MEISIRNLLDSDWESVKRIYSEGIKTGFGTFERDVPDFEKWDSTHHKTCRLLATELEKAAGFVVLQKVSNRSVFDGVAEVSVYVEEKYRHNGIGEKLLKSLIEESEKHGFWTLQSSVFSDNLPSLWLHKKCGFREVGFREKQAKDFNGVWRDTVLLEKRSKKVGID